MKPVPPSGDTEFDAAISALESEVALDDPLEVLHLIRNAPDTIASSQLDRLWRVAVTQSTRADLRVAVGDPQRVDWTEAWHRVETTLHDTMVKSIPADDLERKMSDYVDASRAVAALPAFTESVKSLEGILQRQRALIAFHWDKDGNSYRRREDELSELIATPNIAEHARLAGAKQILEEIGRYQVIYLPKLQALTREVAQADESCQRLVNFLPAQTFPHVHRWNELTRTLIESRNSGVEHINLALELDALLPSELVSGNLLRTPDGKLIERLSEEATSRLKDYAARTALLLQQSVQREKEYETERNALAKLIIGEQEQVLTEPEPKVSQVAPQAHRRTHPIQRRAWYRLAKICWWSALTLWGLLAWIVFPDSGDSIIAVVIGAAFLYVVKAAVFYVALGRTTLWEKAGSGYVDLDAFREEVFESGGDDAEAQRAFDELKARYGRRAPVQAVQVWADRRVVDAEAQKRRALADADKQGSTISIRSLRDKLLSSQPAGVDAGPYRAYWEQQLLRLEVEYGSEIPVSVVSALADSGDKSAS